MRRGYRNALDVHVEHVTLRPRSLPPELAGTRVLLLSDLHLPGVADAAGRLVSTVEALDADCVMIAGDLVETQSGIEDAYRVIEALTVRWPVVCVFGSHDYYEPHADLSRLPKTVFGVNDAHAFRAGLEARGAWVLHNGRMHLDLSRGWLDVIGLGDAYLDYADLDAALAGEPVEGFALTVAHSPEALAQVAARGLPLLLAGHTHGGQIAFPWVGAPITLSTFYRWRRPAGLLEWQGTLCYVGRGFGTTTLPLRYNAPAEVTVITLEAPE